MHKLIVHAQPCGYRRWSARIEWYPSQTNHSGWQLHSWRMTGMGLGSKSGPMLPAQLFLARLAHRVRLVAETEEFGRI